MNTDLNEKLKQYQRNYYALEKHSHDGFKYLIGYLHDDNVIRPLYIILPQMSGYIKYSDNGGKKMSFKIEDESVYFIVNLFMTTST